MDSNGFEEKENENGGDDRKHNTFIGSLHRTCSLGVKAL